MKVRDYYNKILQDYWNIKSNNLTGIVTCCSDSNSNTRYFFTGVRTTDGREIKYKDGNIIEVNIACSTLPSELHVGKRYKFTWTAKSAWGTSINHLRIKLASNLFTPYGKEFGKPSVCVKIDNAAKQQSNGMNSQERKLFIALHDKRQNQYNVLSDHTTRGITKTRTDIYSDEVHFIYELLQNADDESATYAKFELCDDKLLFWHNGDPFTISEDEEGTIPYGDINAITAPALADPKKSEETNKIGKFGVGFKSVYIYTDEPEIYSGHFNFKISHQMIPICIDKCNYNKKDDETLFVLKFKNPTDDHNIIEKRLKNLESPLLFLNHLQTIEWKFYGENHTYTKEYRPWRTYDKITVNQVRETNDEEEIKYIMFSQPVDLGIYGLHNIYVGYQLDKNGGLNTYNYQKVFCFFPTKTTYGMVAVLQAPFLLTQNREQVSPTEVINKKLKKELATLMGKSLPILVDLSSNETKYIDQNLKSIIPYDYHGTYNWGSSYLRRGVTNEEDIKIFYDCLKEHLLNDALFLNASGEYAHRDKVMSTSSKMKTLINRKQLNKLMGNDKEELDFLSYDVASDYKKFLSSEIGIKEFDIEDIIDKIDTNFMESQSEEWIESLYEYANYSKTIKYCSFVKTSKGDYQPLFNRNGDENLFAPISSANNLSSIPDIKFIDKDVYLKHKVFFNRQGVKEPNKIDYLRIVLDRYNEYYKLSDEDIISDMSFVLDIQLQYKGTDREEEVNDLLKERLKFETLYKGEPKMNFGYNIYIPSKELIEYTEKSNYQVEILDVDFYVKGEINKEKIISLAQRLGARSKAKLDKVIYASFKPNEEDDNYNLVYYGEDQRTPYLKNQDHEPHNFYEFCRLDDYDIVNFEDMDFDKELSVFIWESLLQYNINNVSESTLYYRVWHGSKWYEYPFVSSLLKKLKETKWIALKDDTLVRPTDILIDDFHNLGYKKNAEWEEALEFGVNAKAQNEAEKQEKNQAFSDLWNDDFEESAKWAKVREFFHKLGISVDQLLSDTADGRPTENDESTDNSYASRNVEGTDSPLVNEYWEEYEAEVKTPSYVRKAEHFIGLKLYEGYLQRKGWRYEIIDENDWGYDIKVSPNKLVNISVIKNKEINTEKYAPINVTRAQHGMMNSNGTNRFTIIRIALKDLGLNFDKEIRDLFGADADIDSDVTFKKRCEKFAADYWKAKSTDDFERMTAEYQVQVSREL